MTEEDQDHLAIIDEVPDLPETQVQVTDKLDDVKRIDLAVSNDMLSLLYQCIPKASSIKSVCDLVRTTNQTLKSRRDLMCMQYGDKSEGAKRSPFDALD